jgi:hypothetical protein
MSLTKKWVGAKAWLQADWGSSSPVEQSSQVASIPRRRWNNQAKSPRFQLG